MDVDAVRQHLVKPLQCRRWGNLDGAAFGQGFAAETVGNAAASDLHGLARQKPVHAFENRSGAGGELELQKLVPGLGPEDRFYKPGPEKSLGFRSESQPFGRFGVIKRFDAERIAGQYQ